MALHNGLRQSRAICSLSKSLKSCSTPFIHSQASNQDRFTNNQKNEGNSNENSSNWKEVCKIAAAVGLTGLAVYHALPRNDLLAEESHMDQEIVDKENR